MKKNSASSIIILLLSFVFAVACTKKRDAELPYGEDRDLQTMSIFEGKEFDLKTFETIKASSTNGKLKVSDERKTAKSKTRSFDYVRYQSQDPLKLTDDTLMLGLPNHQYKVKYLFQGNLLKVMKLAPQEDLSNDEQAAAIDNRDGRMMVPIVSYTVTFYSIDKKRNDLNEVTSKLELIPLQSSSGATHFKIDFNSKTRATFLSKAMVLPANFFEGEKGESKDWYFAVTVIGMNAATEPVYLGASVQQDTFGRDATKVRAKKLENKVVFFNLGIDPNLQKTLDQRVENQSVAASLPIELSDYQFAESGKGTSVKEEGSKEKSWEERGFADVRISEISIPGWDPRISEIKDVQIGDGYFSFTAKSESINGLLRFSFYNVKAYQKNVEAKYGAKPYQPKVYFPEDHRLFGFFPTYLQGVDNFDNSRKENDDRRYLVTRFNPTRKVIEYRLNHDAPEWAEDLAKKAINGWNASLQSAGSSILLRITDENGKVLRGYPGDLRYSLINIMTESDSSASNWGGLGPALADPTTGEIIMATSNLAVHYYYDVYKSVLVSYLASVRGELSDKYVGGMSIPGLKAVVNAAQKTVQLAGSILGFQTQADLKEVGLYNPASRHFRSKYQVSGDQKLMKMSFGKQSQFESTVEAMHESTIQSALKLCPDLKKYVDEVKSRNGIGVDAEKEAQIISKCVPEVSRNPIISALSHEIGHNLGLRHNFAGSADAPNYYSEVQIKAGNDAEKVRWKSSSIMEYFQLDHNTMTQPGRYDTAAIRWGYQDQVETDDGKTLAADPKKSTKLAMESKMRYFRYCTDEHLSLLADDPFCAQFDVGYDPEKVIQDLINKYELSLTLQNNRLGKAQTPGMYTLAFHRYDRYLVQMRKFYEEWRHRLSKVTEHGQEYLEKYDSKEAYRELLEKAFDEARVGKREAELNKRYYAGVQKMFQFLSRLAFMPDYSCITQRVVNGTTTVQLFSMATIRNQLHQLGRNAPTSCQDKEVQDYLQNARGAKVIGEGGLPFDDVFKNAGSGRWDPQTGIAGGNPETAGIAMDRYLAMRALTLRSSTLLLNQRSGFQPSFLDEWEMRDSLHRRMITRLTKGIPVGEMVIGNKLNTDIPQGLYSLNFSVEAPVLSTFWGLFKQGVYIPGKELVSDERMTKYEVSPFFRLAGNAKASDAECFYWKNEAFCALKDNQAAMTLVKQINAISKRRNAWLVTGETLEIFWSIVAPLIPEPGQAESANMLFFEEMVKQVDAWKEKQMAINLPKAERIHREMESMYLLFEKDQTIWRTAVKRKIDKMKAEDPDFEELAAATKNIKGLNLVELAQKKLGKKDYGGLDQQILDERMMEMAKEMQSNYLTHQADTPEWDAQADILIRSLLGYD
jgi:hypothetical protein